MITVGRKILEQGIDFDQEKYHKYFHPGVSFPSSTSSPDRHACDAFAHGMGDMPDTLWDKGRNYIHRLPFRDADAIKWCISVLSGSIQFTEKGSEKIRGNPLAFRSRAREMPVHKEHQKETPVSVENNQHGCRLFFPEPYLKPFLQLRICSFAHKKPPV